MSPTIVITLAVGLILGFALGWLAQVARTGARVAQARADAEAYQRSEALAARSLSAASEDAARRQSAAIGAEVHHIVGPLRDTLGRLSEELRRTETDRVSAYAGLTEQVHGMRHLSAQLNTQTRALANALHTPHIRGRWGEFQLERVVELAGMTRHCDFDTQVGGSSADGSGVRPDMVVHLAGGRDIVVDAKVPLHAYLEAVNSDDPSHVEQARVAHARALRAHVSALSSKAYWTAFANTPEMVVLFIPSDPILESAARVDTDLIEYAFGKKVVLATPTTLVALLRTVALGWRQYALTEDAKVIHDLGYELYRRLTTVLGHVDKMGMSLRRTVEAYNSTVGAIDARLGVTARKLADLDAFTDQTAPLPDPGLIDDVVRQAVGDRGRV
ncbi:DNA recombination protein RmuC [Gordonia sp. TBRC 11910]|uniref:DNA recombination protein RmuC n=1 Tax=Gordonia asplenii TaxID=2725283 RepID=A0A848KZF8_9ACTN|nr:DNA recombination protein RmuC [Gordonia asplenii]NMO01793.1 DNA recombination protein RmuC [Gordonia asplenii]